MNSWREILKKHGGLNYCEGCQKREGLPNWFIKSLGKCEICGTMDRLMNTTTDLVRDYLKKKEITNNLKSNTMKISGTIKLMMEQVTYDSGFTKREIVIETNDQYPQAIKVEFIKDKIALLDNFTQGSVVEVDINIRGNEHNGNYYVNIQGWRIAEAGAATQATGQGTNDSEDF